MHPGPRHVWGGFFAAPATALRASRLQSGLLRFDHRPMVPSTERRGTGRVIVNGHTDNVMPPYNLACPGDAQAVATPCTTSSSDASLASQPRGFGEVDPVATNSNESGRNRKPQSYHRVADARTVVATKGCRYNQSLRLKKMYRIVAKTMMIRTEAMRPAVVPNPGYGTF
jgi:hypothetical protein